jgi:hypothetical protein
MIIVAIDIYSLTPYYVFTVITLLFLCSLQTQL